MFEDRLRPLTKLFEAKVTSHCNMCEPAWVSLGGTVKVGTGVGADGVAPSQMVGVSASVNLPLHHKVQKFSSGTSSPGWSWKKGRKMVVVVVASWVSLS